MRHRTVTLAACAALLLGSRATQAATFSFSGHLDDGPLAGLGFSGSYSYDASGLLPGADYEAPLTTFTMTLAGQTYTLLTADSTPTAVFAAGSFAGLSYLDADAADPGLRPWVALLPGYDNLAQAYLAYTAAPVAGSGDSGYGSYAVAAVPEPASALLWLGGLAMLAGRPARRGRAASGTRAAGEGTTQPAGPGTR